MKRLFAIALLLAACRGHEPGGAAGSQPAGTPPANTPPAGTATGAATPQPTPPSVAEAKSIIQSSMEFGEFQFTDAAYSLPVSHAAMNDPQRAAAKALAGAGWISLDGAGDAMLNDKSRTDKRFLLRPNGLLDIVPLAKKEMGDVEAVRANGDGTVAADFTWRWIANEVGSAFLRNQFEGTHNATATLFRENGEWRVLKIAPR